MLVFFFSDTATTVIDTSVPTLSLHAALTISSIRFQMAPLLGGRQVEPRAVIQNVDRIAKDQIATIRWIINPEADEEDFAYLPETLAMVVRSLGEQWGIGCELKVEDGNCATSALIGREQIGRAHV